MSKPVKAPVFIAICAAALILFGLIGYKFISASTPPVRTDSASVELQEAMAKSRASSGKVAPMPPSTLQGK